jgi:hypothetical protein
LFLRYPQRKKYCDEGHCRSHEYWIADEISSDSRQNRCFCNTSPQQKPDALQTSAPWQLKCFESRKKSAQEQNSPRQRFHSELFCQIVMYFCRTLYIAWSYYWFCNLHIHYRLSYCLKWMSRHERVVFSGTKYLYYRLIWGATKETPLQDSD